MNVSKLMFTYEWWVGNNNVIKMKTIRKHQTIINPNVTPHRITPFPYIQNYYYYYYYTLYTLVFVHILCAIKLYNRMFILCTVYGLCIYRTHMFISNWNRFDKIITFRWIYSYIGKYISLRTLRRVILFNIYTLTLK